jgi:hypothetical protein
MFRDIPAGLLSHAKVSGGAACQMPVTGLSLTFPRHQDEFYSVQKWHIVVGSAPAKNTGKPQVPDASINGKLPENPCGIIRANWPDPSAECPGSAQCLHGNALANALPRAPGGPALPGGLRCGSWQVVPWRPVE